MSDKFYFNFEDIPNLEGKVAIVTGYIWLFFVLIWLVDYDDDSNNLTSNDSGNSGVGEGIAKALAKKGCKVYIACRSQSRAEATVERLKAQDIPDKKIHILEVDLESVKNVVAAAKYFMKLENRLDIFIGNAGVGAEVSWRYTCIHFDFLIWINFRCPN